MNFRKTATTLALLVSSFSASSQVEAHGALSMDEDACKLSIGPYYMHFTGYQPTQSGNTEFCEDIPGTGQTIIVLDSIDEVLKSMDVGIIIASSDISGTEQGDIILEQPLRSNSRGSITLMQNFASKGSFVGVVTARSGDEEFVARFPFSVGIPPATPDTAAAANWLWPGLTALVVILAILAGWQFKRRKSLAA